MNSPSFFFFFFYFSVYSRGTIDVFPHLTKMLMLAFLRHYSRKSVKICMTINLLMVFRFIPALMTLICLEVTGVSETETADCVVADLFVVVFVVVFASCTAVTWSLNKLCMVATYIRKIMRHMFLVFDVKDDNTFLLFFRCCT